VERSDPIPSPAADPLATVRRRLEGQRLAGEPFDDPTAAVAWLGAVQAQEFAEVKWSLAERARDATDAGVEAAFARGDLIRTHALRPTWHLATREDVRWLLRVTAPRVHALNRFMYKQTGLDAETLCRGHAVVARVLADGEPRTRPELAAELGRAGVVAEGMRLAYLIMHAELEELVASGPRRGKQHTYALLDHRAPAGPLEDRPREALVAELVRRYFTSHGPATVKDFTTWSSLTVAETKAGLDRTGPRSSAPRTTRAAPGTPRPAAWRPPPPTTGAYLIPMYDETIVAYRDLRVVLEQPAPRPGLLDRAIVIDGRTVGSWRRTLSARAVRVEATLFTPLDAAAAAALDAAVARFGRFLGLAASLEMRSAA
jgi:hypothetical protein